jgi:superfamily II DNA or RNA helicase
MGKLLWKSMSEFDLAIVGEGVDLRKTQILMSGAEVARVFSQTLCRGLRLVVELQAARLETVNFAQGGKVAVEVIRSRASESKGEKV